MSKVATNLFKLVNVFIREFYGNAIIKCTPDDTTNITTSAVYEFANGKTLHVCVFNGEQGYITLTIRVSVKDNLVEGLTYQRVYKLRKSAEYFRKISITDLHNLVQRCVWQ